MTVDNTTPAAFLFICKKPGRMAVFTSVDSSGSEGKPWEDDGWHTVECVELVEIGPRVLIYKNEEKIAAHRNAIRKLVNDMN